MLVADDSVLLREGLVRLLEEGGCEVVAQAGDAEELLRKARAHKPDLAVIDVRMPPDNTDDGLRAALTIRGEQPETAVLVLSQYIEEQYAVELIGEASRGRRLPAQGARHRRRRRCSTPSTASPAAAR